MAHKGTKGGPGSRYTISLSDRICHELAAGKPLRQICREEGIHRSTIYDWRKAHADFDERMQHARDVGEDAIADECLEIADDARNDWMEAAAAAGDEKATKFDAEHVQRSKLRIETRLKLLAKWNPSKWGDRIQQDVRIARDAKEMSLEEVRAELAALGTSQGGRSATGGQE
jgi:transposase-like protein